MPGSIYFLSLERPVPSPAARSLPAVGGPPRLRAPPAPRPHLPRLLSSVQGPTCSAHLRRVLCAARVGAPKLAVSPSPGPLDLGLCTCLPHGLGSWGALEALPQTSLGNFSDSAPRQGLEKLAPTRALSGQTAGTRPHLSLSPQPPLWHLRPNLLTMVL